MKLKLISWALILVCLLSCLAACAKPSEPVALTAANPELLNDEIYEIRITDPIWASGEIGIKDGYYVDILIEKKCEFIAKGDGSFFIFQLFSLEKVENDLKYWETPFGYTIYLGTEPVKTLNVEYAIAVQRYCFPPAGEYIFDEYINTYTYTINFE